MATTIAAKKKAPKKKKAEKPSVFRGKRKESIARAVVRKGKGTVRINSVNINAIDNKYVRSIISEPLSLIPEIATQVDIDVNVMGGGQMGQAQASRIAIARALIGYSDDPSMKLRVLEYDRFMLIEDSRRIEPKKYKGPKARARFQKSYR
jgi:small subunit ribosomal protein S9